MQTLETLPFVAGNVALDFVNTAEERGHPDAGDALLTVADLRCWGERSGVLTPAAGTGTDGRAELRHARDARELLYALFLARVTGRTPAPDALGRLSALGAAAYRAGRLAADDAGRLGWQWDPDRLASVRHTAVVAGLELLAADPGERLKQCPGEHCGWFFLDTTRRGNRRWCSMEECGREAKAARRRRGSGRRA